MGDNSDVTPKGAWSGADGLALTLAYLEDPSSVPCPTCGSETVEVIDFVDPASIGNRPPVRVSPEGDYAVILYCHGCERAAAIRLSQDPRGGDHREAA